jgi:hypothetical protein
VRAHDREQLGELGVAPDESAGFEMRRRGAGG